MAGFLTPLLTSIFTPGPTPTLILATNLSFAALQTILFLLLIATWSIHPLALSILCAGLWAGVVWFVGELEVEKEKERQRKAKEKVEREGEGDGSVGEEEKEIEDGREDVVEKVTGVEPESAEDGNLRLRVQADEGAAMAKSRSRTSMSFGDVSGTDSEWDKVEFEAGS